MNTIMELIDFATLKYGDNPAVKYELVGSVVEKSYVTLKNDILVIGRLLQKKGLKNSHIAIIGSFCYDWLVSYFAIICSGNVAIPIDKDLSVHDIAVLMQQADTEVAFIDGDNHTLLAYLSEYLIKAENIFTFASLQSSLSTNYTINNMFEEVTLDPDQLAMIVFTSGTTGSNKGVMLTHRNLCQDMLHSVNLIGKESPKGHLFATLPPHHMMLVTISIMAPVYLGNAICYCKSRKQLMKSIKFFHPWLIALVPVIIETIHNRIWMDARQSGKEKKLKAGIKLSNFLRLFGIDIRRKIFKEIHDIFGGQLEFIISGGAYLDPKLAVEFEEFGILLRNGYGITECSPVVCCNKPGLMRSGSVGRVLDHSYCEVRIINGEICVKGPIVMKGYYKDDKATMEAFDGEWFKTGDLGYIDDDGYLFITGRKKNLIILSDGNNISPEALEQLLEPISLIKTGYICARIENGIQIITACIFPDKEYAHDNGITDIQADLQRQINDINKGLPRYAKIQKIEISENDFETTALGKVKRYLYE